LALVDRNTLLCPEDKLLTLVVQSSKLVMSFALLIYLLLLWFIMIYLWETSFYVKSVYLSSL